MLLQMGPDVYIQHGGLNLICKALLTFSRSESISEVLNVAVTMWCGTSSLSRFDKETCDHWLNRNHGELPQVSLRMAQGTRLNLFTGTSQSCQLRLIKCEKLEIKYGLERWTGFHTYIAKLEFCTNLVLTETTNCNNG